MGHSVMDSERHSAHHHLQTAQSPFRPVGDDLIQVGRSRRWFLQTGLAGFGGLSLPGLLKLRSASVQAAEGQISSGEKTPEKKSVILFWLSGGPSQIDMWDPKPDAPTEIRGPYSTISSKIPGVVLSEHLPLQASIADKLSFLRAVDCKTSNHTPITMQAGNPLARRTDDNRDGQGYPSMGSVVAKFRGSNHPDLPPFVGLAPAWAADVWESGHMGASYKPVKGLELVGKFGLPKGIELDRLQDRDHLRRSFDRFRRDLDGQNVLENLDRYHAQAFDMVAGGHVQRAFDMTSETDATRDLYGRNIIGEKAILARRLVEAGVTYVLVSGAWGYFDHHGDSVQWGGIQKGLTPLLPSVDRALYGLVTDLEQRGLLDSTLILMMGEFGRAPVINKDLGRDHWTNVMSMVMAGGGLRHGQAIGSTDYKGFDIQDGLVRPQDLAATVFRHLDIDLASHWISPQGRPTPIVVEGGRPIPELI
ncbi:DUF1501 domain-containing protein [Schlesneria paludicola]|uniref:DUF1501 domain-containing protein n=1 Tax=Schlesneria paludicola TaxID=360056 RepID=UPI00029A2301|nr:DUF1501 domain-containing protein [Schlesneria paludicola]